MITEALVRKILQVSEVLITVMAFLSFIILLSCLVTGIATGKPSVFGYRVMWVRSPSMEPAIMTGDFILVKTTEDGDVNIGDIAVYRKADAYGHLSHYRIIHRILAVTDDGNYVFKGDNNPYPDQIEVPPKQVEYKAVYIF